jgi:hypothetical protein
LMSGPHSAKPKDPIATKIKTRIFIFFTPFQKERRAYPNRYKN